MKSSWDTELASIVSRFSADIGTIHKLNTEDEHLYLVCNTPGVPEQVLASISRIPLGKGIAGETAKSRKPVNICNLQTDSGKIAKPGAKATKAEGTICVPVFLGDEVVGTLGLGSFGGHAFTEEEINELIEVGKQLAEKLSVDETC